MISRMGGGARLAVAGVWMGTVRLVLASTLLPGCFFTDPVNQAPRAEIRVVTAGPVRVNDLVELSADKSDDPDGETPLVAWEAYSCPESGPCELIRTATGFTLSFTVPDHDRVAVELTVTDAHGAFHLTTMDLYPVNRAPVADVDIRGPENADGGFTVGRALDVYFEATDDDGDAPLTYAHVLFAPAASVTYGWERITDEHYRLIPDVTGEWTLELTASDGFEDGTSAVTSETFRVDEDQPPCIGATTPAAGAGRLIVERDDPPRRFAVESVVDDVDPWPIPPGASSELGGARFRWLVGGQVADGLTLPELWFDASGRVPGEVVPIRVEVSDRVTRTMPCDDATPICPVDGCARRVSWEVEVR